MEISDTWRDPVLINTIGHSAGALLFGVIVVLLLHNWRVHGIRTAKLPLSAAALALGWNLGSLFILADHRINSGWQDAVVAASFSMLTLLPAVLLHVALQGRPRLIIAAGYFISLASMALHSSELFIFGTGLHQTGLLLVSIGFGALSLGTPLLGYLRNRKIDRAQCVSLACLLLFTSSFLHFGYQHTSSPWAAEITWHHIGVPAALIVLLRDYRFLLLDTFLRFAVNFGLAVLYVAFVLTLAFEFHFWAAIRSNLFLVGVSLVAACLSLILFSYLRNALQIWLNHVIFRRQSIASTLQRIGVLAASAHSEEDLIASAAKNIAAYLRADQFAIAGPQSESPPSLSNVSHDSFHPEAEIPLRLSSGDTRCILLGRRRGGQRYWNDDLNDMRALASAVIEQIERFRADELKRLVSQAELRALQAQINPHFLFNALNTLYGTIDRGSRDARRTVLNLAEIFRYVLQTHRTLIPLSDELRIVEAYLEIESIRLGDRLTWELIVSDEARPCLIPVLSLQPLVENAVKHGASLKTEPSKVTVRAELEAEGIRISVHDTGVGFAKSQSRSHSGTGLGLENVRRRLTLSYGAIASLNVQSSDASTSISFLIPNPAEPATSSPQPASILA